MEYVSTRGGAAPATFEEAILNSFAPDGGLYVPKTIPQLSTSDLDAMQNLSYPRLAEYILRLYIPKTQIPDHDLKSLVDSSFTTFECEEITPLIKLEKRGVFVQELFRGPTQSFKDIAMGFLVNCMDYFLTRRKQQLNLILATTGDTGPAAAYAAANKSSLHCWPLFPLEMISEQQQRQMTTLDAGNIHPVGVSGCDNGGDDLDVVVASLFAQKGEENALKLSSVNSINWCRVLVQTVHYFYGYFRVAETVGEPVSFAVPTGAFGNLCAGFFARAMGLPIKHFVCATNNNGTLHRVIANGVFTKQPLKQTVSSAIDIVIPYNFWRYLYFACNGDHKQLREYMDTFASTGEIHFSQSHWHSIKQGYLSATISDAVTLETMGDVYRDSDGYLLDPHAAVAVAAIDACRQSLTDNEKVICLATAHPAKFPDSIRHALPQQNPAMATHPAIEAGMQKQQRFASCDYAQLEQMLADNIRAISSLRSE